MNWLKKNKLLILLVVAFLFLNNLPYIIGAYKSIQNPELIYNGSTIQNQGDFFVYLSMIEMGKQDHLIMKNLYNHESQVPIFLSPQWYPIGQFSKWTGIDTIISYHIFRIFFIFIFVAVVWWWLKKIFNSYHKRILALTAVLFANGVGTFFINIFPNSDLVPTNFWMPESITFLSMAQYPVAIFSPAFILLIFGLFIRACEEKSRPSLWYASLLSLFLALVHPYDAFTIATILSTWTIIQLFQHKKYIKELFWIYISLGLIALHYFLVFYLDQAAAELYKQNVVNSRNILEYVFGLGLASIGSIAGAILVFKKSYYKNSYILLIAIWAVLGWVLVYLPVDFNRRLANGWHIPLVISTVIFIFWLYKKSRPMWQGVLIAACVFLLFFETLVYIGTASVRIDQNHEDKFFYTKETKQTYEYIKEKVAPDRVVLTRGIDGNILPSFTGRTVYVGHAIQTWRANEKNEEVAQKWTSQKDISNWLRENKISYIYASKLYIPEFEYIKWLAQEPYIEPLIDNDEFIFYEVRR
ncbi:hypothetical protein C0580_04345 [Candidatus Parcubacteria bacterium]|nr:MAG: hypothetical protein C0580_04345 [Candidatus Parcubacteria bacterium]